MTVDFRNMPKSKPTEKMLTAAWNLSAICCPWKPICKMDFDECSRYIDEAIKYCKTAYAERANEDMEDFDGMYGDPNEYGSWD